MLPCAVLSVLPVFPEIPTLQPTAPSPAPTPSPQNDMNLEKWCDCLSCSVIVQLQHTALWMSSWRTCCWFTFCFVYFVMSCLQWKASTEHNPSDQVASHQLSLYKVFVLYWICSAGFKLSASVWVCGGGNMFKLTQWLCLNSKSSDRSSLKPSCFDSESSTH